MKKLLSVLIVLLMLLSYLTACKKDETGFDTGNIKTEEFNYWLARGVSSSYYLQYQDNPIMQYVMDNMTFKNGDGEESKIKIKFESPAAGSEVDTYNLMISTDGFLDIMDTTYGMPVEEMYNAGQVLDLTYYVENFMPNYKAFLDANPELYPYVTKKIDGEMKFLSIPGAVDQSDLYDQFCGICYRRDWIVRYGTPPAQLWSLDAGGNKVYRANPDAAIPFSYYYSLDIDGNSINVTEVSEKVDIESWVDNVVFPSGNTDPIYISDWEWMLEIIARAIEAQGIDDGYPMSLYYPGYIATGDISCAFGGGGPAIYLNKDTGKAAFGAAEEGFKAYLQCMNQWYSNGWIDKEFRDKNDIFFGIDETKIFQGKIGLWMGASAHVGARIRSDRQPLTDEAMVFGAPQAINDIYGPDSVRFVEPYVMFGAIDKVSGGICITSKAKNKDIAVLAGFLDYFWSEEGSIMRTMGLGKGQMEEKQSPIYMQFGLTDGAYFDAGNGKLQYVPSMERDEADFRGAMTAVSIPGLTRFSLQQFSYPPTYVHSREQWVRYPVTGFFGGMFNSTMTAEEVRVGEQIATVIEAEYMRVEVPKFITGEKNFEADYETFLNNLNKRNYQKVLDIYNAAIERLANYN